MRKIIAVIILLSSTHATAATLFPYSVRTKDYSGWTPTTRSDINTTGLSNATVGLPSSISAAEANPAGFAMQTDSVTAAFNQIKFTDQALQPDSQPIPSYQWGLAASTPPWGFSIAYYSPITESGTYISPNTTNAVSTEVSVRELRLTVARSFLDSDLAIGVSLEGVGAIRQIGTHGYDAQAISYKVGALYKLPDHFFLGASFAPQLAIGQSQYADQTDLPGFNRHVWRPLAADVGVGWIPNRFFKAGFQFSYAGSTPNTALLADQNIATNTNPVLVPRVGASYMLASFKNFTSMLAVGSYYEASHVQGVEDRIHGTVGFEAYPYFVNLGIGLDTASHFQNIIFGIGVDLIRAARLLSIVPADATPAYNGFFPGVGNISAEGLPEAMTKGEARKTKPDSLGDVGKIIEEAPGNIAKKISGKQTTVEKREKRKKKLREEKLKLKLQKPNN